MAPYVSDWMWTELGNPNVIDLCGAFLTGIVCRIVLSEFG
jgi:hypothetical protein